MTKHACSSVKGGRRTQEHKIKVVEVLQTAALHVLINSCSHLNLNHRHILTQSFT